MTAAPDSRPVDESFKAALAELCDATDRFSPRATAIEAIVEPWNRIVPGSQIWAATTALFELDEEAIQYQLSPVEDFHTVLGGLLRSLLDVVGGRSEGSVPWESMHRVKCAIDELPAIYAALENRLEELEVTS
jgi:hypothetical protein